MVHIEECVPVLFSLLYWFPDIIFHIHTLKWLRNSGEMGRLRIRICIVCSALWIPIRLYSALYRARLSFPCISPDNSNVRITWFCSLLASPLAELFPSCSSKLLSVSLTRWGWLHYLPGRLKVKSLRGVRSQNVSGKDLSRPSFFIRTPRLWP